MIDSSNLLTQTGRDMFQPRVDWACALPCPVCTAPRVVVLDTCPRQGVWLGATIAPCEDADCRALTVMEAHDLTVAARDRWTLGSLRRVKA